LRPDLAITSWDTKLKDKEAGDYVVGQCWWRVAGGFWLMDQLRGQYDHATTANAMALLAVRHPEAHTHHIEAAGSAPEVVEELRRPIDGYAVSDEMAERLAMSPEERERVALLRRRGMANLLPNPPKGDKSVRARAYIAPHAEAGHVRFPADAPWVPALLDEIAAFPDGAHDDQIDTMSQALLKLAQGDAGVAPAAGRIERARPGERTRTPLPGVQRSRVLSPDGTIRR
jgi:predicted phage terminase large subunit-like protein